MRFDSLLKDAVTAAMKVNLPFALFAKPQSDSLEFFADNGGNAPCHKSITVKPWGGSSQRVIINARLSAAETIDFVKSNPDSLYPDILPWQQSTDLSQYLSRVEDLIDRLRDYGGKTVISRVICGRTDVNWIVVAQKYFDLHPEAFRYLYFIPSFGFWLGASPELLLSVRDSMFMTMALAGTRPLSDADKPWSGKNIAEQAVVRDYILSRLFDLGLNPVAAQTETVTTGNIQHLRTLITGQTEDCPSDEILAAINPTPALAGYPMHSALENIVATEQHPRRCYGGYIAVHDTDSLEAFVNLRCVNFDRNSYCIYVGGGIMPDSDPEDEWLETESKAQILRNIILAN